MEDDSLATAVYKILVFAGICGGDIVRGYVIVVAAHGQAAPSDSIIAAMASHTEVSANHIAKLTGDCAANLRLVWNCLNRILVKIVPHAIEIPVCGTSCYCRPVLKGHIQ